MPWLLNITTSTVFKASPKDSITLEASQKANAPVQQYALLDPTQPAIVSNHHCCTLEIPVLAIDGKTRLNTVYVFKDHATTRFR